MNKSNVLPPPLPLVLLLLSLISILLLRVHAQRSFTPQYVGTIPGGVSISSFYAIPVDSTQTLVYFTCNQTIQICSVSTLNSKPLCTTLAGQLGLAGNTDGVNARLHEPMSLQSDGVFVEMTNGKVRKMTSITQGVVSLVGNGQQGYLDTSPPTQAMLNQPIGVFSKGDVMYIADAGNYRIRKVQDNKVTTFAGNGQAGFSGDSGLATDAKIRAPYSLTATTNSVYFVDSGNVRIRRVLNGTITTVGGTGTPGNSGDFGLANKANINPYTSIISSKGDEVYFLNFALGFQSSTIRVIVPNGYIYTVISNMPKVTSLFMAGQNIYTLDTDNNIFLLNSQVQCKDDHEAYINGNCVPVCYSKSLDLACGGPTRGICSSFANCACKDGFTGSECELTKSLQPQTNNAMNHFTDKMLLTWIGMMVVVVVMMIMNQ